MLLLFMHTSVHILFTLTFLWKLLPEAKFIPTIYKYEGDITFLQQIKCNEIILEESEIAKSLINYVSANSIEILVLGAPSRGGIVR